MSWQWWVAIAFLSPFVMVGIAVVLEFFGAFEEYE